MNLKIDIWSEERTGLKRLVFSVAAGGLVALVGGLIGIMGALSCMAGCQSVTPGNVVAFGGLAIVAGSPLVIARVARAEGWVSRGTLGVAVAASAFLLARVIGALAGFEDLPWTIVYPSLGLGAAVALPARNRVMLTGRVVLLLRCLDAPRLDARCWGVRRLLRATFSRRVTDGGVGGPRRVPGLADTRRPARRSHLA